MILTPLFATTHRAQSPLYYPGSHPQRSNLLPPQLSSQSSRSESEDLTYLDLANASDGDFVAEPIPGAVESDIQEDEWFAGDDEWQDQNWEGARSISTYGLCVAPTEPNISKSRLQNEIYHDYLVPIVFSSSSRNTQDSSILLSSSISDDDDKNRSMPEGLVFTAKSSRSNTTNQKPIASRFFNIGRNTSEDTDDELLLKPSKSTLSNDLTRMPQSSLTQIGLNRGSRNPTTTQNSIPSYSGSRTQRQFTPTTTDYDPEQWQEEDSEMDESLPVARSTYQEERADSEDNGDKVQDDEQESETDECEEEVQIGTDMVLPSDASVPMYDSMRHYGVITPPQWRPRSEKNFVEKENAPKKSGVRQHETPITKTSSIGRVQYTTPNRALQPIINQKKPTRASLPRPPRPDSPTISLSRPTNPHPRSHPTSTNPSHIFSRSTNKELHRKRSTMLAKPSKQRKRLNRKTYSRASTVPPTGLYDETEEIEASGLKVNDAHAVSNRVEAENDSDSLVEQTTEDAKRLASEKRIAHFKDIDENYELEVEWVV